MIELYGRQYLDLEQPALTQRELSQANGFYKIESLGICLYDLSRTERAFIRKNGNGPVSLTRTEGKRNYKFSTSEKDGAWLGEPSSFTATVQGAKDLAKKVFSPAA